MKQLVNQILIVTIFTLSAAAGSGENALVDHVFDPQIYMNTPFGPIHYGDPDYVAASNAATSFIGDGGILSKVGGIFWDVSYAGVVNYGDLTEMTGFELRVWNSTDEFIADPIGNVVFNFGAPSNPGWEQIIGVDPNGAELYYLEFDVSSLQIPTTLGQTMLIAVVPWSDLIFISGRAGMAFSNGGFDAIGLELDWYFKKPSFGPDTLQNLGVPHNWVASFITTIAPPSCLADLDSNGTVEKSDLIILVAQWGTAGSADFDGSGAVGTSDLLILFANWGPCP